MLGMAYKPDISDLRESPGLEVYELYKDSGANVRYYDPYATSFRDKNGVTVYSVDYDLEKFGSYDCIVLVTNHSDLDYGAIASLGVPIVDTRNAFKDFKLPHIYKIGHSVQQVTEQEALTVG
ncbi:UDP-N-acetyl-D-glucosamine 6-dehydrogenase [compost metagenome]